MDVRDLPAKIYNTKEKRKKMNLSKQQNDCFWLDFLL